MVLKVDSLTFSYGADTILHDVSLSLGKGEIGCLVGPSGAGKTTLLKLIAGFLQPGQGSVSVCHQPLPQAQQHISFMMQEETLLPWRTALDNVTLAGEIGSGRNTKSEHDKRAMDLLAEMELQGCEQLYPDELSAGMRLRVSLARALFHLRPLMLLDEPFGPLDAVLREQMHTLLQKIRAKYKTAIFLISHDIHDALTLADTIFLLKDGTIKNAWPIEKSAREDFGVRAMMEAEIRQAMRE